MAEDPIIRINVVAGDETGSGSGGGGGASGSGASDSGAANNNKESGSSGIGSFFKRFGGRLGSKLSGLFDSFSGEPTMGQGMDEMIGGFAKTTGSLFGDGAGGFVKKIGEGLNKYFTGYQTPKATTFQGTEAEAAGLPEVTAAGEGSMASLGAVAGPAGLIIGTIELFDKAADMAARGLQSFGEDVAAIAHNDYWSALDKHMHSFVDTLNFIPNPIGMLAKVSLAAVDAVKVMTDAFISRAHEIGVYSAPISLAEAKSDIRQTFADIKEAQTLGPGMARLIDAQSQLSISLQEIFLPIKELLLDYLVGLVEMVRDFVEWIKPLLIEITERVRNMGGTAKEVFLDVLAALFGPSGMAANSARMVAKAYRDEQQSDRYTHEKDMPWDMNFNFNAADRGGKDPIMDAAKSRIAPPIFAVDTGHQ